MRIISGIHGGRKISPPANMPYTRPTTDLAKEGLFNILQNNLDFEIIKTLDIFGGTGGISYELASRGVPDLTIVEQDKQMFDFIVSTAAALKFDGLKAVRMEVFRFLNQCKDRFDFIFAGPPYALTSIDALPTLVFKKQLLNTEGWFVLEHTPRNSYEDYPYFRAARNYGTTVFSIFINRESGNV
jgi:16S rRNA (guanine966-N2)-methyltransferase